MKNSLVHTLEKPEKDIYIYALCEPGTTDIRYIGLATNGFKRLKNHWVSGYDKNPQKRTKCKSWIKNLRDNKKIFNVIYLEYFDHDTFKLDEAEIFYISYIRSLGFNLLNHTEGGRREYMRFSEEQRKQKIVHNTPEAKANFSKKSKEMWSQPGFKEENSKLIKEALNKPAMKEKLSKTITEAIGLKIQDDLGNIYESGIECAKALGVKRPNIYRALRKGYKVKGRTLKYLGDKDLSPAWTEYKKKNQRTVTKVPLKCSNGKIYPDAASAAQDLNVHVSHVNKVLRGQKTLQLSVTFEKLPPVKEIRCKVP